MCNITSQITITGIICIGAEGNVEGTDKIQLVGTNYKFTGHIRGPIIVENDDIVIDGEAFLLQVLLNP